MNLNSLNSQKEVDKVLSDISAIQNAQQTKLEELTAAVERSSLEAKKSNTELLTAVATKKATNDPEPTQEAIITWWEFFSFVLMKLFGGWKRIIITLPITVIAFLIFKVFEKNILIFLYEVISERLKLILPPTN
jgi:hypothetical protein